MSFRHRIVLTGGGTGGHIYPALAVAEQLQAIDNVDILYIGAKGHLEERLARERGLEFVGLTVSGMPRQLSANLVSWPFQYARAIRSAFAVLARFRPTVLLGTGGYASAAPLTAALLSGRKFAIHEPDAHPGLANRLFGRYANLISLGMAGAQERFSSSRAQLMVNGNPVAKRFLSLPEKHAACTALGLDPHMMTVLITGGSQGALALNQAVYQMLPMIEANAKPVQILHQIGEKNWQSFESDRRSDLIRNSFYKPHPYLDHIELAYAAADLAVCRAGAMTIAELSVTGTPAIFVPFPFAAQDHQTFNARYVERQGAAQVLLQSELDGKRLYELIVSLSENVNKLAMMKEQMIALGKPHAAAALAQQLVDISSQDQQS